VTSPRALALPVAAGLVAAAATFAVITAVDGDDERGGAGQPRPAGARAEAPAGGRALFFQMGCGSCHRFADAGSTGTIGPNLDERLAGHDRASLTATILTPLGSGAGSFSVMPDNFGDRMSERALDELVAYLLAARPGGRRQH
jgi:mono/diheme cytochrome c family protein